MPGLAQLIIVLGSPNSDSGELSAIAKSRLDKAIELQQQLDNSKILLTGGFGEHFNRTHTAHAEYARQYLQGILEDHAILESIALSTNTIEDAIKSKPIVDANKSEKLSVVSSEFHLPRVRFIFDYVFQPKAISYVGAKNCLLKSELPTVIQHEQKQLAWLKSLSNTELANLLSCSARE